MIKKIKLFYFYFLFFFNFIFSILSTIGIETNKFNKLISNKIAKSKNINLKLKAIKFKLDLKEFSLFIRNSKSKN